MGKKKEKKAGEGNSGNLKMKHWRYYKGKKKKKRGTGDKVI